jgi:hypothetical protein
MFNPIPPRDSKKLPAISDDSEEHGPGNEDDIAFPTRVRTAAKIWIVMSGVILVYTGAISLYIFVRAGENAVLGGLFWLLLGLLFGAFFLNAGIRSMRGQAVDIQLNGIGSMGFGLLNVCVGGVATSICALLVVVGPGAAGGKRGDYALFAAIAAIPLVCGLALVTAGRLALASRGQYLAWRRRHENLAAGRENGER